MGRLTMVNSNRAETTVKMLYKDLARRAAASPPGLCPVDMAASFLKLCHAQTCGKCVPCRIGLGQLGQLLEDLLNGDAGLETIGLIEKTARGIHASADCAIGYEAAGMVLNGLRGFQDDYVAHALNGRCSCTSHPAVPCVAMCPAGVDVPAYIALVANGRHADAVRTVRNDNPFPVVCGMICEHPCEAACRRNIVDAAINIRGLKRYAADHAGTVPVPANLPATGKRVGIVGGGPGGLTAAYYLALMGHEVTVFEQRDKLGGMLRYGIPNYRLPRTRLNSDIDAILSTGIKVRANTSIGKDLGIEQIKADFDALFIAIGAHGNNSLRIEGETLEGVTSAVELLRGIGDEVYPDYTGRRAVIVGGGNVAMDAARTALRLGAKSVTIAYRRRKDDMTALPDEIEGAVAEGCGVLEMYAPLKVEGDENGKVAALWMKPQITGFIKDGRPSVSNADAGDIRIPCDIIVVAIGQGVDSAEFEKIGIPTEWGNLRAGTDGGFQDVPGVFSGGDCVTGPSSVIKAIAAGKVAAANIDTYLGFSHHVTEKIGIPAVYSDDCLPCGRTNTTQTSAEERKTCFEPIETGMSAQEAKQESGRCLRCDHYGMGSLKGGRAKQW